MGVAESASRVPSLLKDLLECVHLTEAQPSNPGSCLRNIVIEQKVIQEFRPLAESLEWELARLYWCQNGIDGFARNEVPYIINNDGQASADAAATFYAYCQESIDLPQVLKILELGAGTGLFARYFLDTFADICRKENVDFYDRLLYYVTDGARRTVEQWEEQEIFAPHVGHYVLAVADAILPSQLQPLDSRISQTLGGMQAIFCNYLLDVMPASIVRVGPAGPEQLVVRTCLLDDPDVVAQYTQLSLDEIRSLAESGDINERKKLLPLLPVLDLETRFDVLPKCSLYFLDEALAWGKDLERILLSHGALSTLNACLELLDPDGFLILNDYGLVRREDVAAHAVLQRFGGSAAHGINFPLLEHYGHCRSVHVITPLEDEQKPIHTRMVTRRCFPGVLDTFMNRFSNTTAQYRQKPREEARIHAAAGRRNEALDAYRSALAIDPHNWCLLGEVAEFVALQLRDFRAGLELARTAILRNAWYSGWLWNIVGDCLFCLERFEDAYQAYLQAEKIDPADPRTHLNLAYSHVQQGEFSAALQAIARGLAADARGQYRERLFEKQQQILLLISTRWLGEQERLARRVARFQ